MRTRRFAFAVIAVLLGVFVFIVSSDQEDREAVEQMARKERQIAPAVSLEIKGEQSEMFRLTSRLTAEKDGTRSSWTIEDDQSSTVVELPFSPPFDGVLPGQESDRASNSTDHSSSNPGFTGASACAECHRERYDGFIHTAHHKTSGIVKPGKISGHFAEPRNSLKTSDPNLFFTMKQRDDRCLQEVSFADWNLEVPLDVFTGSAKAGQSFLYWHQDALYQTHVSYLNATDEWIPSPGYGDTSVTYTRVIRTECLECHITYVDQKRRPNVYHRDSAVWGISCERCHGPGRQHVEFHREHPEEKTAKHIVHPSDLRREQQLQICGQCHSGSFSLVGEAFSYRPGDDLDKHHKLLSEDFDGVGGIHTANQLTRLAMSECFQGSEMTCTTCHDPHENQRGDVAVFTKSCRSCHQPAHCGMFGQLGEKVAENCIECHMPVGENEGMTLLTSGGKFTVSMIDHYIRIDEKATDAYLSK